jgi:hypothetical protein
MNLFYKPTDKELLNTRNRIFLECGAAELYSNGFIKSPFATSWFGRNNLGDFTYEFIRLKEKTRLEFLVVHISKGDAYIKLFLNVFEVENKIKSVKDLDGKDALKLHLPPCALSMMRLRSDDYKFIPLITVLFYKEHKLGTYWTKKGFDSKINSLCSIIRKDCQNIDGFIKRWHKKYSLQTVNLE